MKIVAILLLALAVVLGVVAFRQRGGSPSFASATVTVGCADELQAPVTAIVAAYQRESGVTIRLQSAPVAALFSALPDSKQFDLLLLSEDTPLADARKAGTVREILPLALRPPATATNTPAPGTNRVVAAVPASCPQPAAALGFARFLAAPEKGGPVFQQHGFTPADGDRWAPKPELILYSGGVNRLAIEKLLRQFADREGVNVTTVFNGCGVLCATMKAMGTNAGARFPDAYYACDLCFVPPVAAQFPEAVLLTETDIGIVVKKGNPRGVTTLADLAQPGLKLGLCNAEQSTLGFMTRGMLKATGLAAAVGKNVATEVPTADLLINQMRIGGLDAAIVYRVNAIPQADTLDFFPIQHAGAKAIQPFAVRERSPNRQLARRLLAHLQANRGEFEKAGFLWRGNEAPWKSKDIQVPDWLKP
ncbi:hypothetical protein LBMAG56_14660 [Verrucomicrobiota bacterium]|nr:hypothetical protein LBMAG56_14660 [Verrucomicrobiota bacterium]